MGLNKIAIRNVENISSVNFTIDFKDNDFALLQANTGNELFVVKKGDNSLSVTTLSLFNGNQTLYIHTMVYSITWSGSIATFTKLSSRQINISGTSIDSNDETTSSANVRFDRLFMGGGV